MSTDWVSTLMFHPCTSSDVAVIIFCVKFNDLKSRLYNADYPPSKRGLIQSVEGLKKMQTEIPEE